MDLRVIVITAILIVVVIALLGVYLRSKKNIYAGKQGEKKVAHKLKWFAGIRNFKVINDIYLPLYDKTTQIDHILIGYFGMLVIETKNYKGDVYGNPKEKEWLHIVGDDKNKFYNPLMQNQTHIDAIRHILAKEKIYKINIDSLIVFTGGRKSHLYIPKNLPIIKVKKLGGFLRKSAYEKDNNVDIDLLYNTLLKYQVTDKKLLSEHNKNVKKMAKQNRD